jgi:hypothetical protein
MIDLGIHAARLFETGASGDPNHPDEPLTKYTPTKPSLNGEPEDRRTKFDETESTRLFRDVGQGTG